MLKGQVRWGQVRSSYCGFFFYVSFKLGFGGLPFVILGEMFLSGRQKSLAIQGRLQKWTEHWILTVSTQGAGLNLNNVTQTHSIFTKLSENTFLGMPKVDIFTLVMSQVKTQQSQNLALCQDCCKRQKSVILVNLSKNGHV